MDLSLLVVLGLRLFLKNKNGMFTPAVESVYLASFLILKHLYDVKLVIIPIYIRLIQSGTVDLSTFLEHSKVFFSWY